MPLLDRPAILWTCLVYLAIVAAIGVWSVRRTRGARDFFIAGQSLGLLVTGLATMTAAFSGFVFLGGPGLTYRIGVGSLFICLPVGFTAGLLGWVVAKRLRLMAEVYEVFTVPDALLLRYRSRVVAGCAAVAIVCGSVAYLGAQLQALGVLVESILGMSGAFGEWSLLAAMGIGLAVVLFYSVAGGMVAGVYTDLFQGALMTAAAIGVFAYAGSSGGGWRSIFRRIADAPEFGPEFLDPLGTVPLMTAIGFFFVFGVGVLGQPQMLHKFYMLGDLRKLKWLPAVLGGSQALCLLIWLGIGLAVPALVASGRMDPPQTADHAAPLFLLEFVPEALAGLVIAGILAAIMSTADSFLNIASAALVRDLPKALGRTPSAQLRRGRWAVLAVAVAAAIGAHLYGDLIALLGTFAFGTFAAAIAPAVAVGLNWRRVTARAAGASIATGLVFNLGLEFLARQKLFPGLPGSPLPAGVLPSTAALVSSFAVLFLVTMFDSRRRQVALAAEMERILEL